MRKNFICIIFILLIIGFILFTYWQNSNIKVTEYSIVTEKIENEITIVHISDLHNKDWGNQLYELTKQYNPDFIALTGDVVDYYKPNIQCSLNQIKPLAQIAPVYFVTGNHESYSNWEAGFIQQLWENNIIVLNDTSETLSDCMIIGLSDNSLNLVQPDETKLSILLAHRPEHFDFYATEGVDIVLSGHTHGGQLCLPILGGFYAPNQGFFPKYLSGKYENENSTMIISRGLGNSSFPFRIFNQPEFVVVHIKPANNTK